MAMTGMRRMTRSLGLLRREPPEEVLEEGLPWLAERIPPARREAVIELAHWLYGGAGGAAYALLPESVRRQRWAGPLYGVAHWVFFETVVAPVLGIDWPNRARPNTERASVIGDHLLYGLIVGRR